MKNLDESKVDYRKKETGHERESTSRDTRIRSIHEMEELRRAQELRVDEFSVQQLRESHDTIQRTHFTSTEFTEIVNCTNDSGEFQETGSNYSEIFLTFQLTDSRSKSSIYVETCRPRACHLKHGICLNHRETFFGNSLS